MKFWVTVESQPLGNLNREMYNQTPIKTVFYSNIYIHVGDSGFDFCASRQIGECVCVRERKKERELERERERERERE